jgi:hypothetical protein
VCRALAGAGATGLEPATSGVTAASGGVSTVSLTAESGFETLVRHGYVIEQVLAGTAEMRLWEWPSASPRGR